MEAVSLLERKHVVSPRIAYLGLHQNTYWVISVNPYCVCIYILQGALLLAKYADTHAFKLCMRVDKCHVSLYK